ncbi:TetR/AcrR family transcriptional regulator [Pseudonocardia endophytica]|uniref:TetR family transcriptional regulator n=1 Tax=Pseudonocardia endophytica TaxID=401976 RepID=A0A4R1HY62_PSEEN|nr:TetR/AcrR family transcriptional regulator [Pseudonocardia endophytica]TCK26075.1 TetR family transcriptional regulator [Pseudonocardia endophytica]
MSNNVVIANKVGNAYPSRHRISDVTERPYHHGQLRSALLTAAEHSLREHGAGQLSLRELARDVGVSHAAPRRHFPDRQALLDALAEAGFDRLGAELRAALDGAGTAFVPRLRATVTAYIRFAVEDAALLGLMFASKHRPGADCVVEAAAPAFALMYDLITEGQAAGALAAGDPERVGIVLFATMQGIAAVINGNLVEPSLLDDLVETAVTQFVRGAGPTG